MHIGIFMFHAHVPWCRVNHPLCILGYSIAVTNSHTLLLRADAAMPTDVQLVANSSTSMTAMWSAPPSTCPISFQVGLYDNVTGSLVLQSQAGPSLSSVFSGLTKYYPYYTIVTAVATFNGMNASATSSQSQAIYTLQDLPGAVVNLNVAVMSATVLSVTWNVPPTNNVNGIITYYSISWYSMAAGANGTQNVTASVTSYNVTGLVPCTTYNAVVQADWYRHAVISERNDARNQYVLQNTVIT
jgi:hypothetical protein